MSAVSSTHRRWQAALLVPWALLTWRFWFLCDDAYITFRFSRNLALGRGLVFNPGESPPVEGYSNFLWMLLATVLEVTGLPVELLAGLSAITGAVLLVRVFDVMVQRLGHTEATAFAATLPLALSPVMAVWSTSGLATMPFALGVFMLFEAVVLSPRLRPELAATVGMLLVLVRAEGWAWVLVLAVLSVLVHGTSREVRRSQVAIAAGPPLLLFLVYTAWRFSYYGTLVPNTALVKVGFGPDLLLRGGKYVLLFWLTTLVPLLSLAGGWAAIRRHERRGLVMLLLAVAFPAYGVLVGGDFMPFGRLLVPGLAFSALLLAELLRSLPARSLAPVAGVLAVLAVLPAFDVHPVPLALREPLHFRLSDQNFLTEWAKWDNMLGNTEGFMRRGKALALIAEPGDAVVSGAVGAMGYAAGDLWVWDQYGLVTKEVAYRPFHAGRLRESPGHDKKVEAEFFAKYAPRFLYARSVKGRHAASQMKDSIYRWEVDPLVTDQYVPDFVEVDTGEGERTFLLMVRRALPREDPAAQWLAFEEQRRKLHAELKEESGEEIDDDGNG